MVGVVAGLMGCAGSIDSGDRTPGGEVAPNTESETNPFVEELPEELGLRQNVLERRAIFEGNWLGGDIYGTAIETELQALGIDVDFDVLPMTPDEAPRAVVDVIDGLPTERVETDIPAPAPGSCAFAEDPAEAAARSISCRFVATQATDTAFVGLVRAIHDNPLPSEFVEDAPDADSVQGWYETAAEFGIEHSAVLAVDALRAAGICDTVPTPRDSAREMGAERGAEAVRQRVRALEASTPNTRCDTDAAIVNPAGAQAREMIPDLFAELDLCPGWEATSPEAGARLERSLDELRAGIELGIESQLRIESARLVREWVCVPPVTVRTGGGTGDPLVLDLDGNGISVEPLHLGPVVEFGWGGRARTEWLAPGDAFVVFDRDGDGDIDQTELFGDVSLTADGQLARDGFEMLALYDTDRDGVVDAADEMFAGLGAWRDIDGDGQVDRGELTSLSEVGVTGIDIDRQVFLRADGSEGQAADLLFDYVAVE